MMIFVDFGKLDTFNYTYGFSEEKSGALRVPVEGGLAFPHGMLLKEESGIRFLKYKKDNFENMGEISPKHYIYDPSRRVEYVEWKSGDDHLLRARTKSGEWVQYTGKVDSQYVMHEFVGDCWSVFEGVYFSKGIVSEYTDGRGRPAGNKVVQKFGSRSCIDALSREYSLEGVLKIQPGPGQILRYIHAKSFHIEIPDV